VAFDAGSHLNASTGRSAESNASRSSCAERSANHLEEPRRFLHGDQLGPYAIELSPCLELGRDYSAPDEKIDGYGIYKSREEASEQEGFSMMLSRDVAPGHLQTPGVAIASGG
jgi:hypothetical protein